MTSLTKERAVLEPDPLVRQPDGTIKQRNPLTGTQVWSVPGRGHRPLQSTNPDARPLHPQDFTRTCAFCTERYYDTPPEKSRLVKGMDQKFHRLEGLSAERMHDVVAEFRRIPNLFEIVSYNYWHLNHNHYPTPEQNARMAAYLATEAGYNHVLHVVKMRLAAAGETELNDIPDERLLTLATGLFAGGQRLGRDTFGGGTPRVCGLHHSFTARPLSAEPRRKVRHRLPELAAPRRRQLRSPPQAAGGPG